MQFWGTPVSDKPQIQKNVYLLHILGSSTCFHTFELRVELENKGRRDCQFRNLKHENIQVESCFSFFGTELNVARRKGS